DAALARPLDPRITYKLQERAYGGLSLATARKLEHANADPQSRGAAKPVQPISLRPGTRLVREWRGVTHMVLIHADGVEWRGQRYRSLTIVARKITGARWSGPRFFGSGGGSWTLTQARERAMARVDHARAAFHRPLRDLHSQVVRRGARAGIQFSRRPAGGARLGRARQPTGRPARSAPRMGLHI